MAAALAAAEFTDLAAAEGFEPPSAGSKPAVLPLDDAATGRGGGNRTRISRLMRPPRSPSLPSARNLLQRTGVAHRPIGIRRSSKIPLRWSVRPVPPNASFSDNKKGLPRGAPWKAWFANECGLWLSLGRSTLIESTVLVARDPKFRHGPARACGDPHQAGQHTWPLGCLVPRIGEPSRQFNLALQCRSRHHACQ